MSSPIAHGSLMWIAWPALERRLGKPLSRRRRVGLGLMLAGALMAPDLDLLIGPLMGRPAAVYHNGASHSLIVGAAFAIPFGGLCSLLAPQCFRLCAVFGFLAYGSHVLIDWTTWGRGVQMVWPISPARFAAPVLLFRGVRHSVNASVWTHLMNLRNDIVFAGLVWMAARGWRCRARGRLSTSGRRLLGGPPRP